MVKQEQLIKENYIAHWKNKYVNYYSLKQKLLQLKNDLNNQIKLTSENDQGRINNDFENASILEQRKCIEEMQYNSKTTSEEILKSLYTLLPFNKELEALFNDLTQEIKNLFVFYIDFERKIYIQVNKKLNRRHKFYDFTLKNIHLEMGKLREVLQTLVYFSLFLKLNFSSIKKIVNKIETELKQYYGEVTLVYLKSLLEKPNSNLNYMLNCKIICEVNVLINILKNDLLEINPVSEEVYNSNQERNKIGNSNENILISNNNRNSLNNPALSNISLESSPESNDNNKLHIKNKKSSKEEIKSSFRMNKSVENFNSVVCSNQSIVDFSRNRNKNNFDIEDERYNDIAKHNINSNKTPSQLNYEINELKEDIEDYLINLDNIIEEINDTMDTWKKLFVKEEFENKALSNVKKNMILPDEMDYFKHLVDKDSLSKYQISNQIRKISVDYQGKVVFIQNNKLSSTSNNDISNKKVNKNSKLVRRDSHDVNENNSSIFSTQNKFNIVICLVHVFLYMFLSTVVTPTNSKYLKEMGLDESITGIVLAATPLAAIFSTFIFTYWSNFSYKVPFLFTIICFIVGNFMYSFAYHFKSILMVFFGRLIVGIGAGRIVNRRYLIEYIPKSLITTYSVYYNLFTALGLCTGPLVSIFLSMCDDYSIGIFYFNPYTLPGWVGVFCSFILLIVSIISFTEPINNYKFNPFLRNTNLYHTYSNNANAQNNNNNDSKASKDIHSLSNDIDKQNSLVDNLLSKKDSSHSHDMQSMANISLNNSLNDSLTHQKENISVTLLNLNYKLDEINDHFTSTDLFKPLIKEELETSSFNEIKVCFFLFSFSLVLCRILAESLMVSAPVYLKNESPYFIEIFLTIQTFSLIPIGFAFKYFITYYKEKKVFLIITALCCLSTFTISYLSFNSLNLYFIFYLIAINLAYSLDTIASSLFIKTYINEFEKTSYNSGFIISYSTTSGRTIGSLLVTVTISCFGVDKMNLILYGFVSLLFFIICLTSVLMRREIRVKAISKLYKS